MLPVRYFLKFSRCILFITFLTTVTPVLSSAKEQVVDPYQEEGLSCISKPDGRLLYEFETFGYGHFRILADLNFDGREDIVLSTKDGPSCGNGGCSTAIYLKQTDGSYARTELGLHPLAANLTPGKNGVGELTTYWHMSAEDGVLATYTVTVDSIIQTDSRTIFANEKDRTLYENLFNSGARLKAEYSRCKSGTLQWSPSYE
jgi:hypothetical protein